MYCDWEQLIGGKNILDREQGCASNPLCSMFYDARKEGNTFYTCPDTAEMKTSSVGSILYLYVESKRVSP